MPSSRHRCYTYLTEEEHRRVEKKAAMSGKTVSAFLRDLALGYQPATLIPQEHFEALLGLKGELRRLGNLLKSSAFSGMAAKARELADSIGELVQSIARLLERRGG